jgi:hypothetical protein
LRVMNDLWGDKCKMGGIEGAISRKISFDG